MCVCVCVCVCVCARVYLFLYIYFLNTGMNSMFSFNEILCYNPLTTIIPVCISNDNDFLRLKQHEHAL